MKESNDRGYLEFQGNELHTVSIIDDKPKNRLASPTFSDSSGGGAISYNVLDEGTEREIVLIKGEQSDKVRGQLKNFEGMIQVLIRDGSIEDPDAAMQHVLDIYHNDIVFYPKILEALKKQLGIESQSFIDSPNKQFRAQMQDDGNFVVYDRSDPENPIAIWNSLGA